MRLAACLSLIGFIGSVGFTSRHTETETPIVPCAFHCRSEADPGGNIICSVVSAWAEGGQGGLMLCYVNPHQHLALFTQLPALSPSLCRRKISYQQT